LLSNESYFELKNGNSKAEGEIRTGDLRRVKAGSIGA
jgi:hypothetical protein